MLPGSFSGSIIQSHKTRVTVDGVERPVVSVSLDGEMRSDLPSQISRSSGTLSRGGSVVWGASDVLDNLHSTPFRDYGVWRPSKGQRIVVYVGDGISWWPRFSGLVDETTGEAGGGFQSSIIADLDRLSAEFICEAHLTRMPPLSGSTTWRNAGLAPMFFVDAAMRAGGYYVTPPTISTSVLHVPLQGSLLPAIGTRGELLPGAGAHTGSGAFQENWSAPWGLSSGNFKASYSPRLAFPPSTPLMISMMFTSAHAGSADVIVHYGGSSNYVRLVIGATGNAVVQTVRGSTTTEICRIANAVGLGANRAELVIRGGSADLRLNTGQRATGTVSGLLEQPMSRIDLSAAPAARIAGVQVSNPETWEDFQNLNFTNTARIRTHDGNTTTWGVTNASPRFEAAPASSVLEGLADATLSGMWFDELGVLNFAPANGIRSQASAQTITTADDVLALAWSDRLLAVASRVTVGYLHPALKNGSLRSIEVARGSKQTLSSGDYLEDVYTPDGDTDWLGVDTNPRRLPDFGWEEYNGSSGSFVGVTYYDGENASVGSPPGSTSISVSKTGLSEYTVIHEAATYPAGVTAETATYPVFDGSGLWPRNRDRELPVLRAWALVRWVDRETTRQVGSVGPVLRIDLGGQATPATAERVRDYLHAVVSSPYPQITDLEVVPDPRRQMGDVITIQSENYLGVTLRCLITSISESMDGHYSQSLGLDVLNVTTGSLTWAEWESSYPGTLTFAQWEALRGQTDTYNDFNTDPLKGA